MLLLEKNAIFIHIPKTAGQSIEDALLHAVGKNRAKDGKEHLLRYNPDGAKGPKRLAHLSAQQYVTCGYIDRQTFETAFSFAIVRNPWDRVVSFYKYLGFSKWISFSTFVAYYLRYYFENHHWFFKSQVDFIYDEDDRLLLNFVGRFENLENDFQQIIDLLGCPNTELEKINVSKPSWNRKTLTLLKRHPDMLARLSMFKNPGGNYRQLYDNRSIETVSELYSRDIDLLEYKF